MIKKCKPDGTSFNLDDITIEYFNIINEENNRTGLGIYVNDEDFPTGWFEINNESGEKIFFKHDKFIDGSRDSIFGNFKAIYSDNDIK